MRKNTRIVWIAFAAGTLFAAPALAEETVVPSNGRSDTKSNVVKIEAAKVEQNKGKVNLQAGAVERISEGGTQVGVAVQGSARTEVALIDGSGYSHDETLTFLNVDLGLSGKLERTKDTVQTPGGKGVETTKLELRAPSLAIFRYRNGDKDAPSTDGTVDVKVAEVGYSYQRDDVLKTKAAGADLSVVNTSFHVAGKVSGIPMELCGALNPGRFIAGTASIQGQERGWAWAPTAEACLGAQLGEHVNIRNTTAVGMMVGAGHEEPKKGDQVYADSYNSASRSLSNTTIVSVNLGKVKPYLGYTYSIEHSEDSHDAQQTNVQSHQAFVGVAAF